MFVNQYLIANRYVRSAIHATIEEARSQAIHVLQDWTRVPSVSVLEYRTDRVVEEVRVPVWNVDRPIGNYA